MWRAVCPSTPAERDPVFDRTRSHATVSTAGSQTRLCRSLNLRSWSSDAHLQLALDPEYPRPSRFRHRTWSAGIHRRPPRLPDGRCKPAAPLRHVPGSPGLRLLRELRPRPAPSADAAPSLHPEERVGDTGRVPTFTAVRLTGSAPSSSPAALSRRSRGHASRSPDP